ncbi:hypothetical protein CB1_000197012 [Camelus ferus]|nr:hypothetical protein CB1_000197012 [Camelus ferus]
MVTPVSPPLCHPPPRCPTTTTLPPPASANFIQSCVILWGGAGAETAARIRGEEAAPSYTIQPPFWAAPHTSMLAASLLALLSAAICPPAARLAQLGMGELPARSRDRRVLISGSLFEQMLDLVA